MCGECIAQCENVIYKWKQNNSNIKMFNLVSMDASRSNDAHNKHFYNILNKDCLGTAANYFTSSSSLWFGDNKN